MRKFIRYKNHDSIFTVEFALWIGYIVALKKKQTHYEMAGFLSTPLKNTLHFVKHHL